MPIDISIIVVNWNVCDLLRRCLASIRDNRGDLNLEVIVVDNASADGSVTMVGQEFPWVHLIASQENLGYTGGNNLGAREAQGRYLFILNPDTEIVADALETMVTYLDEHPAVGMVGPQLLYPDGSIQPSRRRFPQLATAIFDRTPFSQRWFPDNRFERAYYMADTPDDGIQPVDWLVGAALMIRQEAWEEVGPLDGRFFMYSEETDWCHRCWDAGWEIDYLPQAQVIHHARASAEQIHSTARLRFYRSRVLYYRKYFGAGWAAVLRLFLLGNFAWLLAVLAVKWMFGSRTKVRRQRMAAYWRAIKSGLQ